MTIEKGMPWGRAATVPGEVRRLDADSGVAGQTAVAVQVTGGNLWRALGCPPPKPVGAECTELPVDVLRCTVSRRGRTHHVDAVADVVVGSWFARAGMTVVTNVGVHGPRNLAPRAHPNDGEFDILRVDGRTTMRQRFIARRRALTGTHVPHPTISVRRATTVDITRDGNARLVIDGVRFGPWDSVRVEVRPDVLSVLV